MSCEELRENYELFALGIADDPERSEITAHLDRGCPTCVPGVRGARELMTLIGASAPAVQPPARLRKRVLAIAGVQQPARRWAWSPVWAAVAAGAIIAAIVFNVRAHRAAADLVLAQADLDRARTEVAAQTKELARLNEAMAILNQPDVKQVVFGGAAPQPPRGRVFLDPRRGVLLLASNLQPAPAGKIYEMWVIPKGGKPVPAGLFQSSADGSAVHVLPGPVDVKGTAKVAVTLEVAAGAQVPNLPPVFAATL